MQKMSRKEILDKANECVNGDRDHEYGSPEDSFETIAAFWNAYLGLDTVDLEIEPRDVAAMLALLKLARISSGVYKADNWIDLAGYAACGGEIESNAPTMDDVGIGQDYPGYDIVGKRVRALLGKETNE